MSCYYHPKVPTIVVCRDCGKEICSSCSQDDVCPGCRLERALTTTMSIQTVAKNPSNGNGNGNGASASFKPNANDSTRAPGAVDFGRPTTDVAPSVDDRLLSSICYLLWPIALLLLVLPSHKSRFVRFHVVQALGVNVLGVALYVAYALSTHLPVIGWQSALMAPFVVPAWFLIDLYLAVRAYGGHVTRVPIASDFAKRYAA